MPIANRKGFGSLRTKGSIRFLIGITVKNSFDYAEEAERIVTFNNEGNNTGLEWGLGIFINIYSARSFNFEG